MRPPAYLYAGPHRLTFESDPVLSDEGKMGEADTDRNTIRYAEGYPLSQEQESILHETLHVAFVQTGLRDELGIEYEEAVIGRLSPVLLQIVRDNPALIEYLTQAS